MSCISFVALFYLVKTKALMRGVDYGEIVEVEDVKQEDKKENEIIGTSTKAKAINAMNNIHQNNPITEESRKKALDAMKNMNNN
jgi:hypothetical protein